VIESLVEAAGEVALEHAHGLAGESLPSLTRRSSRSELARRGVRDAGDRMQRVVAWRSPPRESDKRMVCPEEAGLGAVRWQRANAALALQAPGSQTKSLVR